MSALSQLYNQSRVSVSQVPPPSQVKAQGWISPQVGFGEAFKSVPFLMFESLTPMPPPIASPSPPATESMRTLKSVPMNNASVRLSMVPSLPSFSLQQEAWGNAANVCYKRLASMIAKNMINPIAAPCSG